MLAWNDASTMTVSGVVKLLRVLHIFMELFLLLVTLLLLVFYKRMEAAVHKYFDNGKFEVFIL